MNEREQVIKALQPALPELSANEIARRILIMVTMHSQHFS